MHPVGFLLNRFLVFWPSRSSTLCADSGWSCDGDESRRSSSMSEKAKNLRNVVKENQPVNQKIINYPIKIMLKTKCLIDYSIMYPKVGVKEDSNCRTEPHRVNDVNY